MNAADRIVRSFESNMRDDCRDVAPRTVKLVAELGSVRYVRSVYATYKSLPLRLKLHR
jgi:hypothetical protein